MKVYWLLGLVLFSCTKKNPSLCCVDEADCNAVGLSEVKLCEAGLACVENQCILQSCETDSCSAAMPVCNASTNVCEACTDSSACARFPEADVCDAATGGCVDCVAPADCPASAPVCDANACRACSLDSECASGACGDDGKCVDEALIAYIDPGGTDSGSCTKSAPCRSVSFAVSKTSAARNHVVMAQGAYVELVYFDGQSTPATHIVVHGNGATLSAPIGADGFMFDARIQTTIRDLSVQNVSGVALAINSLEPSLLERVRVFDSARGILASGSLVIRDVVIENASVWGISADGSLTIDRVTIRGGGKGITSVGSGGTVQITNLLAYGTGDLALDLVSVSGTVASSTIADSGTDSGTGPRAVLCNPSYVTVRSTIIWAPGSTPRAAVSGCNMVSVIAGPTPVAGTMNVDPLFVDAASRDYHLAPNSPARDQVDAGPPTDIDGDMRPLGARFDIGADEALP